ncbi:acetyl-coenzyme A synthetase AcsA (plasmid) [Cupriavidus necator N-1]|uniref:Acetyl-coenzyme A synthetase AcsA n=1 Tax=Cupriavidus necator (strain ATCC 43291 / DSM 13513 / CCUG 52238 / LMG 8453 / N-1) TaxID=1042878 RepID=F8GWA8_CUPNN|nr:AMP-binding protein [Cupriavidus necator]AEI81683.1 acetyl-coenzyme A synthetase AcsA [Cupriavidus necator N-1]MDX6008036.1 AMP-binding protein [Cupriavidus necator]
MEILSPLAELGERVSELIDHYADSSASLAWMLCDRHDPASVAYDIVDANLRVERLTYGELRVQSEAFAAGLLDLGVRSGDRVATLAGKSLEYLVALLGIWRIGAVHVPLFTAFAPPAVALRLEGSGARVVVCDASQRSKLSSSEDGEPAPRYDIVVISDDELSLEEPALHRYQDVLKAGHRVSPAALGGDAPFIHIYTSGTTGKPKGVVVPSRAIAAFHAYVEFGIGLRADDVYWCAADPGWAYGLYFGVVGSLCTGVQSVFQKGGFDPALTYDVLRQCGVTNFAAAPTVFRSLMCADVTAPAGLHLRSASSAGEPLTPDVNEWAAQALGVSVYDHYGQTEAGMLINNHHDPRLVRPIQSGCMGISMPGWKAVVLDRTEDVEVPPGTVGRIAFKLADSPLAWFAGYDGLPEKSAEKFSRDGQYYLSGDLARADETGAFFFSSREDDVIIMAGYRIGPFEVESVLTAHPAVAECAVIAVPDKVRGEVIEAYVVLRPGFEATDEAAVELQQWVKTRYAAHAYPRRVTFISELPKTPSGKVQRFVLREARKNADLDGKGDEKH